MTEEREVRQRVLDGYRERLEQGAGEAEGLGGWLARCATRILRAEPDNPDGDELRALVKADRGD